MRNFNDKKSWSRPLADLVEPCISPVLARYGFGEADIITCWSAIVGERVAAYSQPLRLKWVRRALHAPSDAPREPATLILQVDGGGALELQHMAATVIERINAHLGWRCVGKLALRQAPLERRERHRPKLPAPSAATVIKARASAEGIIDDGLREALVRLGSHALRRQ